MMSLYILHVWIMSTFNRFCIKSGHALIKFLKIQNPWEAYQTTSLSLHELKLRAGFPSQNPVVVRDTIQKSI